MGSKYLLTNFHTKLIIFSLLERCLGLWRFRSVPALCTCLLRLRSRLLFPEWWPHHRGQFLHSVLAYCDSDQGCCFLSGDPTIEVSSCTLYFICIHVLNFIVLSIIVILWFIKWVVLQYSTAHDLSFSGFRLCVTTSVSSESCFSLMFRAFLTGLRMKKVLTLKSQMHFMLFLREPLHMLFLAELLCLGH